MKAGLYAILEGSLDANIEDDGERDGKSRENGEKGKDGGEGRRGW